MIDFHDKTKMLIKMINKQYILFVIPRIKFLKIKYEIQSYETFKKGHKNNTQIIPVQYPSKKIELKKKIRYS